MHDEELGNTLHGRASGAELLFAGPGEMRARCRAFDWSATPLGSVESWAIALRSAVRLCLDSGFPTVVHAGPQQVLIYNDPYIRCVLGGFARHPWALGRPAREVWADVWDQTASIYARVRGGEAVTFEDRPFVVERGSGKETSYWTSSVSAIREDDGNIVGIYSQGVETTSRVRAAQAMRASDARKAFLLRLGDALRPLGDGAAIQATAARILREHLLANQVNAEVVADSADEVALIEETAECTRAAVERVRGEAALRESRATLALELQDARQLQSISSLLINDESGAGIYDAILDAAMVIMRANFASIQMLDAE